MISERLNNREVLPKTNWFSDEKYDAATERAINKHVRRLVITMRMAELTGRMPLDKCERCVIRAFEKAEMLYCGLDIKQLMDVVEMEKKNDKGHVGL